MAKPHRYFNPQNMTIYKLSLIFLFLLNGVTSAHSQELSCRLKYFENNKKADGNAEFFAVVTIDTIPLRRDGNKILFKEYASFQLIGKLDGEFINFGRLQRETLPEVKTIIIGKVTDIRKIPKAEGKDRVYIVNEQFPFIVENPENVSAVYWGTLEYDYSFTTGSRTKSFKTHTIIKRTKS